MRVGSDRSRLRMIRIRSCFRLICNHPVLFLMFLFMIYLRISFPYVFFLLISASPIVVCTAILLGGLLVLGQKQAQGTQNDALKGHNYSSSRPHCTSQTNCMTPLKKGGGGDVGDGGGGDGFRDKFAEVRKDIVEKEIKEPRLRHMDDKIEGSKGTNNVDHLMFVYNEKFPKTEFKKKLIDEPIRKDKADDIDHSSSLSPSSSSSSVYEDESDALPPPTLCDYHPLEEFEDHHDQVLRDESLQANERALKLKGTKEDNEVSSIVQEDHQEILELSSSDNEHKQQLEELIQNRSHDYDIDVHDDEEEDEHTDTEEEEDDDDDDVQDVEQDCIKTMVNWTEEDEKNLKDLSRLELERNRQLERIMSKRIAQKTYSTITEKSLMDLDTSDLPITVAPVLTAKTNPFDLSYPPGYRHEMPPIPGSAPAFFPRRNPFDDLDDLHQNKPILHNTTTTTPRHVSMNIPSTSTTDHQHQHQHHHHQNKSEHAHLEKNSVHLNKHQSFKQRNHESQEGGVPQDSTEASKREALFRRYQSFGVVGSSFYGFRWQENEQESPNLFNPYFSSHEVDHSKNINGPDSLETNSSQGSTSDQTSSSSNVMEDQEEEEEEEEEEEVENASESSTMDVIEKEKDVSLLSEADAEEEVKHTNVEDDAMKLEGDSSSHIEHVEPVYDSYDTSPTTGAKNIFLGSESPELQEGKYDT